jgi:hypothetical protein
MLALAANVAFLLAIVLFLAASAIPQVSDVELWPVASGSLEPAVEKIRSPQGFIVLVAIPGVALFLGEVPQWYRTLKQRRAPKIISALEAELEAAPGVAASPFLRSAAVLSICVVAAALGTYALAPRLGDDGAGLARMSDEAASIADHSVTLADGEAFDGDIQVLRNAEDPRLRDPATPSAERLTALRQMLLLNTNRFEALTVLDLDGRVRETTDEKVVDLSGNAAYRKALDWRGVAAVFADQDIHYAAPVLDPAGNMHAVLLARTTADRLWSQTLSASIDGSRTLIVSADGNARAADGSELLVLPGATRDVTRVELDGLTMYCAARPIGVDTHLDAGLRVASCLPVGIAPSTARSERLFMEQSIGAMLAAISLGVLVLAYLFRGASRSRGTAAAGVSPEEARLLSQREYYT